MDSHLALAPVSARGGKGFSGNRKASRFPLMWDEFGKELQSGTIDAASDP